MRQLKNDAFPVMKSPLRFVMVHIHEAIVNIVLERKEKFLFKYIDLTIENLDTNGWKCGADPKTNYIALSRRVVEILWTVSYAYITFHTKVIHIIKPTKKTMHRPNN
jgi:hypothetical protein